MDDTSGPLTCPLLDCEEPLYLAYTGHVELTEAGLATIDRLGLPAFPDTMQVWTWDVHCTAGHVLALPSGDDVPVYFGPSDARRLVELVAAIGATVGEGDA